MRATHSTFTLPDHNDLDINIAADKIAKHFSTISQEFPPIDAESLPQRVKKKIFHSNVTKGAPTIEEHEVYEKFKKRKLKNFTVYGDIPKKNSFLNSLSQPPSYLTASPNQEPIQDSGKQSM